MSFENVKIRSCLSLRPRAVVEADPDGKHFFWFSQHFSGYDRRKHDAGRCSYMPVNLGEIPDYYRRFMPPVDMVIFKCCQMDANGYFNFSAANLWHRAATERARVVIVEVTGGNPWLYGDENGLHVSEVDYVIEGDDQPAAELPNPPATDVDRAVGRLIASEIEDGACLQIGIGGMPNAVCAQLLEHSPRNLGVHTEMLTDGIDRSLQGRPRNRLAQAHPSRQDRLQFWSGLGRLLQNPRPQSGFLVLPRRLHQPAGQHHAQRPGGIDQQYDPDRPAGPGGFRVRRPPPHSGTGGQLQFVRGAYASKGGKSFICLSSTYNKRGEPKSRIVLNLTPGNIVTTPRTDVMYVVTEYGMVSLKGKSVPERAKALIAIAHPDFRETLERQAYEHRLIPHGVSF